MFWQEETPKDRFRVPDDVIDLLFTIDCRELPVDHGYELSYALRKALPWISDDARIGVHTIHTAGSQNGWERPEHGTQNRIILSRRTKLMIRVPGEHSGRLQHELEGSRLDVGGCLLTVGSGKTKPLSKQTTLFSRFVVVREQMDENAFLHWVAGELDHMGVRVRKALCGKMLSVATPEGSLLTRSLMLADLTLEESLQLQQRGLGSHRYMGCGIFIPHKGVDAVKKLEDD
jgi:CRISPR-associated protein Cas6